MRYRILVSALISATALSMGAVLPVSAETAAPSPSLELEEIIVTARRVEERLQDVPISIKVFNQTEISNLNIVSAGDLSTYTPSLQTNSRFGSDNTSFSIRGFEQANGTAPTVGVYFADVVAPRVIGGTSSGNGTGPGMFFDLQNVQVLKGPQGTLFGRNTTGGAVLLVPQKPNGEFGGYVEGSAGDYDMRRIQGAINVPISDAVRFRIGADRQTRTGYLKNFSGVGPDDFADVNYTAARASLVVDITPNLENYTILSYSNSNTHGLALSVYAANAAGGANCANCGPGAVANLGRTQSEGYYSVENPLIDPYNKTRQWQAINTTTWKASDALTIKNIMSYGQYKSYSRFPVFGDNISPTTPQFVLAMSNPYPGLPTAAQKNYTEELQFQGRALDQRLTWQAGAYLELMRPDGFVGTKSPVGISCSDSELTNCVTVTGPGGGQLGSGVYSIGISENKITNKAAYAQSSYELTSQLTLTAGLRYTMDKQDAVYRGANKLVAGAPPFLPPGITLCADRARLGNVVATSADIHECTVNLPTAESKKPTGVIDLEYKPIEDVMIYGKYARGYRMGGINQAGTGAEVFGPEKLDSYELGTKTSFRSFISGTFDVAAFSNKLSGQILLGGFLPTSGSVVQGIGNGGKSSVDGFEVDSSLLLSKGLTMDLGYTYLDSKLESSDIVAPPGFTAINFPQPGNALNYAPRHKFTGTATYTLPLSESIGKVSVGVTYSRTSTTRITGFVLPYFDVTNANLNWNSIVGLPIDAAVFVTNLTNTKYATSVGGGLSTFGIDGQFPGAPRMVGLRLKYRFGE